MEIMQEQSFEINNLITQSGKFKVKEFQESLNKLVNRYKAFSKTNGDYIITTTKSIEIINGEQIMEVEILMPVNYLIPVDEPYIFKSKLKLTHALHTKVTDIAKLQDTLDMVNNYILEQKLEPITSAYLVQIKEENQTSIEIYVGINPNVV